jgi:hypothetical protein
LGQKQGLWHGGAYGCTAGIWALPFAQKEFFEAMDLKGYKVVGTRKFYALQAGDIFKAVIQNIRPGEVTIRFDDGELYTARSYVLPEARIGEESLFYVQENDMEGRIILKMMKLDTEVRKTKMLTEALSNARLAHTPEMIELARAIINAGLPADADTLQKAAALMMSMAAKETETGETVPLSVVIELIIAMLLEEMPAVQKNVPPPERFTFDMRV